jgi:tRNA dimethylallyltransferase
MQVYGDLRIMTARPDDELTARAPHRLYGVLDGATRCSAGRWRDMARLEIEQAQRKGMMPILVGGTGLYFRALLHGLAPIPAVPQAVRDAVGALHARDGSAGFHARLAKRDPAMAERLAPGDTQRVVRAYEVIEATGRSLAEWQAERHDGYAGRVEIVVLAPPRPALYEACNARFGQMTETGALDEVAELMGRGLDPRLPVMKAVGVAPLADHLAGRHTLERAIALGSQATRRYAKRQSTWFRHQLPEAARLNDGYRPETKRESLALIEQLVLTGRG